MKIFLDNIIYSLQPLGGISVVWTNLLEHLLQTGHDLRFLEYDGCEENVSRKTIQIPDALTDRRCGKFMQLRRYFNPMVRCNEKFLFHSSYFRYSTNPNALNISTVHDFTYEYCVKSPLKRWFHCRQKYAALRHSEVIVCISESTKRDLQKFLPDIPEERIRVIYNGVDEVYRPLGGEHEDFMLFVGDRRRYKNYLPAVEIARRMGMKLVVVGRPLQEHEKFEHVVLKAHATNAELNELYNRAFCLLYPSFYEGFGLPIVEAQKAGCPVLALNTSSIPEVIGETPLLVDDLNLDVICEKLEALKDESLRRKIVADGLENSARFSWKRTAEEYLKLYDEIYSK